MDLTTKQRYSERAALWNAKKKEITCLVANGLDLSQIEDHLHTGGTHMTAPLRDYIIWEQRSPEVVELFSQGLDIAAVEEKMQQKGWLWTETLRRKAAWEFHREEIIRLYKGLHSVEAVQKFMFNKGFRPQTRIYYEWLQRWGISTNINRSCLSEIDDGSHGSPFGSSASATPASMNFPSQSVDKPCEITASQSLQSPFPHMAGYDIRSLPLQMHTRLSSSGGWDEELPADLYESGDNMMDIDDSYKLRVIHGHSQLETRNPYTTAPQTFLGQNGYQSLSSLQGIQNHDGFYDDLDGDNLNKGEIRHDHGNLEIQHNRTNHNIGTKAGLPLHHFQVESGLQSKHGKSNRPQRGMSNQASGLASRQMSGAIQSHRDSADSGYWSKTSSIQSAIVENLHRPRPASNLRDDTIQEWNEGAWIFDRTLLHTVGCLENHQGLDVRFTCCGSSILQELAQFATSRSPQEVYGLLCKYMQIDGVGLCDAAGNTFLHKLAVVGADWEYFEAAFGAGVDPCHQNAYGQTFAHVLNFSRFSDNLTQHLSSLQKRGLNFGLRDNSGRTLLHCIYSQPITPQTALDVLEFFDLPGRQLSLRDTSGRTPREIFKETDLQFSSKNPRWSTTESQLQALGRFQDIVNDGVLRLKDDTYDPMNITNISDAKLRSQYKEVLKRARNGILIEAVDGSNAYHAQAALETTIHDAADDLSSLERFIAVGIDANDYDNAGRTPLEATIIKSRDYETELATSEKVSLLIRKGRANVHTRNRLGHTPLYSAAIRGLDRTLEVLLKHKSHVNIRANDGTSLLAAVVDAGHDAFMDYLISGYSKYHEAQCSRIEACRVLLERYGAVIDPTPAQAMGYPQ